MRAARIVSVDPGEEHVGVCTFIEDAGDWQCSGAFEFDRPGAYKFIRGVMEHGIDRLVYETWQIYPDKAQLLTGSKCETAECIGVIKYLADQYGVAVNEQPAAIQTPTQSLLKSQGLRSRAKRDKAGPHALSAELHGWCYLYQNGLIPQ